LHVARMPGHINYMLNILKMLFIFVARTPFKAHDHKQHPAILGKPSLSGSDALMTG
jgi:hypothetical protein